MAAGDLHAQIPFSRLRRVGAGAVHRLNPSWRCWRRRRHPLLFQLTGRQVPIFLGSSFIAPIIFSIQTWGILATMGALACVSLMYFVSLPGWCGNWHGAEIINRHTPRWWWWGRSSLIIGLSLAAVGVNMAMGRSGDGKLPNSYATALMVAGTFSTTVLVAVFARGFPQLVPSSCGVAAGYCVAAILFGLVDFAAVGAAPWFVPLQFVTPSFELAAILFMLPVALAPAIEHVGDVLAIGGVTGKDYTEKPGLHRTLAGDGAGVVRRPGRRPRSPPIPRSPAR